MEQFIKNVLKQEVYSGTKTKALHLLSMGNVLPLFEQFEFDSFLEFEVLSESNPKKFYYVSFSLSDWYDDGPLCSCPQYPIENNCKHVAACLLYLLKPSEIDIPIKKPIETQKTVKETNQTGSNYMDYHEIVKGLNHSQKTDLEYKTGFANPKIIAHHPQDNQVTFSVDKHEVTFTIKDHSFEAKCTCQHKKVTLCLHSRAVLFVNFKTYRNPFFIRTFRDITKEKQVLLKNTGLTPSDETVNDIYDFYFEFDRLQMKPKKNVIFDLTQSDFISKLQGFKKKPSSFHTETIKDLADGHILILKLGAGDKASNFSLDLHPYLGSLQNPKKIKAKISFKSKKDLKNIASEMVDVFFEFTNMGKVNTLRENGRLSPYYRNDNDEIAYNMNPEKWDCVDRNLLSTLEKHLPWLIETNEFFLNKDNISKISFENLSALSFSTKRARPHLKLEKQQSFLVVTPQIIIDNETFNVKDFISIRNLFFLQNQEAFLVENFDSKILFDSLIGVDELKIHTSKIHEFVKDFLLPNRQRFSIDIPEDLIPKLVIPNNTKRAIRLKELEPNYLIIEPFMIYDEAQIVLLEEESFVLRDGKTVLLDRNLDQEKEFEILVKNQHPDFESQENNSYFFLPISKVIQNHWFLDFFKTLAENSIEIYGQKELKKLKFNLNRPKISISGSSGIDWFDLKIELTYGDEVVPLKILKSAIVNKQDYITLADGSLGILPEEWIKKFSPMLKLGNTDKGNLRMSKLHFGMIDAADEFIQDKKIQNELAEKKKSLSEIDNTTNIPLPKNIKAKLRPYQLSGFQWFNKLYQLGWGGCLADDMGLGKTLQSLAFIRHVHNQKPEVKSLIVCPTSLIYNWLAESSKFTPDLRTKAYHGTLRELPEVQEYDLLITSYGTFRNDLEKLKDINFEICILDESQAIKNPAANISKAVGEINTRNRFILSGTPLQNNTFDLFSQFNFINPGLLGSRDYFKEEFSTPIDKYADSDKSQLLRKMIYPFMLRRTKDQVAKDLPDKTESIIYCEMDKYQRKVYDGLKIEYRDKILGKIAEQGLEKSAFLILEGLNKLRMACDCPSLIKDGDTKSFKSESVKLNEIIREMDENSGQHKVLIFSQFLGMLELIRGQLAARNIKHLYLDGSTPAKDRQGLVDTFQTEPDIKVFLISLKAGGVGLNLTAADYVYIVDPWWNPAVEDQAIDRTHRIGQTNKVFAYKLICKDTIEEKIHALQQKKKALAKEIVAEEASFIKKLSKDDVAWLLE